jgi:hypothetical protein
MNHSTLLKADAAINLILLCFLVLLLAGISLLEALTHLNKGKFTSSDEK